MEFYYPDNMEAPPILLLWKYRDLGIIFFGGILSLFIAAGTASILPLLPVTFFTVLTATISDGLTILSYLKLFFRYFISQQLVYFWSYRGEFN
jgi:hypothetical protein